MELCERDLLMLSLLAELNLPLERNRPSSVKEWIRLALDTYGGDESGHQVIPEAVKHDRLHELPIVVSEKWEDVQVFTLNVGAENDRLTIFGFVGDAMTEGLRNVCGGHGRMHAEAVRFLRAHDGNERHMVTGHGIGGALALYAASHAGCGGTVFDAPGIGHLPGFIRRELPAVVNYLAYDSLLSAVGDHPETVRFARLHQKQKAGVFADPWTDKYAFDDRGMVVEGERGSLHEWFSQLNQLDEQDAAVVEEVVTVFAKAVGGEKPQLHDPAGLLAVVQRLENHHLPGVLEELERRMGGAIDSQMGALGTSFYDLVQARLINEPEALFQLEDSFRQLAEQAVDEVGRTAKIYCLAVQLVLSAWVIRYPEKNLEAEFERALERMAGAAESSLRGVDTWVGKAVDGAMEAQLKRLMASRGLTMNVPWVDESGDGTEGPGKEVK